MRPFSTILFSCSRIHAGVLVAHGQSQIVHVATSDFRTSTYAS
jgi:hypothetical protein